MSSSTIILLYTLLLYSSDCDVLVPPPYHDTLKKETLCLIHAFIQ